MHSSRGRERCQRNLWDQPALCWPESGIDGGIHAMYHMWELHSMEEEWGVLLIDASNAFNKQNQTGMLWTVWHE
jgi:hypothetical protein